MAVFRRTVTGPLTHHSGAVSQFTAIRYSDRLTEANIAASIGSVGDSYDNAMAEAPNGTFKAELAAPGGLWRTRAQLETEIIDWIYWYNEQRLHKQIGDLPPTEYEQL
jgi:putative transposase